MTNRQQPKKLQVITFKVPFQLYDLYEIACIEQQQTISKALQETVRQVVQERQKDINLSNR